MTPTAEKPQHMRALARANRVRLARATLKRAILKGDVEAAEVCRELPWETETMTLIELLASQRRWGNTRARKLLRTVALAENKTLGSCTARQRNLLAEALERKPHPSPII